jgi:cobaltochelatase CobN
MKRLLFCMLMLALGGLPVAAAAVTKVALVSTRMVLERKFALMQAAARTQGIELAWTQVDAEGEAGVERVLDGARFVLIDAPRVDDQALVERIAGDRLRSAGLPGVAVNVMSPPVRLRAIDVESAHAQRVFEYYVGGMRTNHERLFAYLAALLSGADASAVPPPARLPDAGIYHSGHEAGVFADLPAYLDWWERRSGEPWQGRPVIGMEISSSYVSDGQTRMLDEAIRALEESGAVPLLFYRASRVARARGGQAAPAQEPMITLDGKSIVQVLLVNTFLGVNPDARRDWHRSLGIPAINVLAYRSGTRTDYLQDTVGVNSFNLPFTLVNAEYIGLQDPVVASANEGGELVPIPEQMQLLVGKAVNLARLQSMPNADKKLALFFWNHPPGEKNQGASNLNVPRSIDHLVERLREHGYAVDATHERDLIAAAAAMLQPGYRAGSLGALMRTPHWDFLPLDDYRRWFATLPDQVRAKVLDFWGDPEQSPWIARHGGVTGFVIPRMKLGQLAVMPQPMRSESAAGHHDEKKLFHDTKVPLNHFYMAAYLWVRERHRADAIVHFGTHGTQEWTPGKERGLWAWDDPNILVGNTPVVYPYIVDNIGEAVHVKRRGRGVIVSHQTPAFAPAGLSGDYVRLRDLIREYRSLDQGLVKENNRKLILAQAAKMNIDKDLDWKADEAERDFEHLLRGIEDYLEDLGTTMQPLGLHTLGRDAERAHLVSNVMQMLGEPLIERTGAGDARTVFADDYEKLQQSAPYRFVDDVVFSERPLELVDDPQLRRLAQRGREFRDALRAELEIDGVLRGLSARWIDPSYGGDPIRNPDALPTGRNMYGFDPSRIPTRAAWEAGRQALQQLLERHRDAHGREPEKLAFSMWSTETMRHLGMLEAQVLYAMGARPVWDEGGRVTGVEPIPHAELGRPRIDVVISLTGLYRDQFPNVIERFNQAVVQLAALDEPPQHNHVRANTERIRATLSQRGVEPDAAREFALTRVFGNESGDYSTRLTDATLASDKWETGDGKLVQLYLSRMSWAYGPDPARWSSKPRDGSGAEVNAYAEHLRGTSAAVFSRSSNLRGLLDTDHPFEYLGGISMAVRHLDGRSPQLYISNMRDPQRARLETAGKFLAKELRAIYQHPNWVAEMQKEGYAGTLQLLNAVNNFWGWQVMDRNVVRDDQWQAFHDVYVKDRYQLGMREWFEKSNPTALAQIAERMLEAIRKDYWKADERTRRELVRTYAELARKHDVRTANEKLTQYVTEWSRGFGLDGAAARPGSSPPAAPRASLPPEPSPPPQDAVPPPPPAEVVRGQELREVEREQRIERLVWIYAWLIGLVIVVGAAYQAWATWRERRRAPMPA